MAKEKDIQPKRIPIRKIAEVYSVGLHLASAIAKKVGYAAAGQNKKLVSVEKLEEFFAEADRSGKSLWELADPDYLKRRKARKEQRSRGEKGAEPK